MKGVGSGLDGAEPDARVNPPPSLLRDRPFGTVLPRAPSNGRPNHAAPSEAPCTRERPALCEAIEAHRRAFVQGHVVRLRLDGFKRLRRRL
jgi:hypothetical protein